MAFKITKKEAAYLQKLADAYEFARDELSRAFDDLASEWENDHSEKSERWQESEAGQTAQGRIDLVRGWEDEIQYVFEGDVTDLTQ